ncbi:MAG: HRDC domain-containing protein [Desulfobacterales bacterium]|nr:HRDC domain-containing protein [Desulfobacterales bacterium]
MVVEPELIETLSDLEFLGKQLDREEALGVDIEADSLHHYFPKVCLIQISTDQNTFVIDPLAIQTIDPLRPMLSSDKIKKVFHGADYDLRSLFRDFSIEVKNLFDTMVASQFIGEKELGLAALLNKRFGILLDKKYQRANWAKRPLSRDMVLYAAHDTAHLIRLYHELEQELKSKERLNWLIEECKRLSVECTLGKNNWKAQPGSTPMFKRFKGAGKMEPMDLAILENLLLFRERKAMQEDRPPFRLFATHVIKELVRRKPADYAELRKVPGLSANFMKQYAGGALKAIRSGLALPADRLPSFPKRRRPPLPLDPKKKARLKLLKAWREEKSGQLAIEPGLVCNNALLSVLAEADPKEQDELKAIPGMKNWQRNAFGQEIIDVLQEI